MNQLTTLATMLTLFGTLTGCVNSNTVKSDNLYNQCHAGDTNACFDLGGMYYLGNGIAQNLPLAADFTQRACNGNHSIACNNLGIMYEKGQGVTADPKKAFDLYERSCTNNAPSACYNQGSLLTTHPGLSTKPSRDYFQKACDLRLTKACAKLY